MPALLEVDLDSLAYNMTLLLVAFVLPMLTAWDREAEARSAGLRTFPLVSMAACAFTLLAMQIFSEGGAEARILSGVITGIGFIGGGAILKSDSSVSGVSTAAAIWSTGAVGMAVGLGRIEIAIALSLLTFATFRVFRKAKKKVNDDD
ncbi:MAG: MgtC/SapB family protein [Gammaproteobacteria bacterium]|nr:MgtC/SapB family protein [Gammaproteobacteria bacterium]